jgi:hypothetical protein
VAASPQAFAVRRHLEQTQIAADDLQATPFRLTTVSVAQSLFRRTGLDSTLCYTCGFTGKTAECVSD